MPVNFTAIDFETANSNSASACSVGLIKVRDGLVVDRAAWLMRPAPEFGEFLPWNIKIHGIRPEQVADAPSWAEQLPDLLAFLEDDVVVAHNAGFDMGVIKGSCAAAVQPTPKLRYLCSVQVARKTYELPSYKLPAAAAAAGFAEFSHHDALADAEACAAIISDAARRFAAPDVPALAKLAGVSLKKLVATPLKL